MPTSNAKDTTGSWFPSGYYGHTRNKERMDFVCEYRQLAKPQPPSMFVARSLRRDIKNPFSMHDNRNSFCSETVYFDEGHVGKRKCKDRAPKFDPEFYSWLPLKHQLARGLPHLTSYQTDFTATKDSVHQLLVTHPPTTCLNNPPDTTYHYYYCAGCPHKAQIRSLARGALDLSTSARQKTGKRIPPHAKETVASCLSWYRAGGGSQRLPNVAPDSAGSGGCNCQPSSQPAACCQAAPQSDSSPPRPLPLLSQLHLIPRGER